MKLPLRLLLLVGCCLILLSCAGNEDVKPQMQSPVRLSAVTTEGLWVADHLADRVFLLDRQSLEIKDSFPVGPRPAGVVVASGRVFVAEQGTGRVSVYNLSGTPLFRLGQGDNEFLRPNGMALNAASGLVYIADLKAKEIRVFTLNGTDAGFAIGSGELNAPTAVTFDPDRREILVSDFGVPDAPQVRVYAEDGTFLRSLPGTISSGMLGVTSIFSTPQGLTVDGKGHLFLVDSLLGQVLVLDELTGELLKTVGQAGTGNGELFLPLDVTIDPGSGDLLVANSKPARIEVYRQGGVMP
ncbi:hypothetical protein [Geothermobacter hydrogeniphilus]|uniref:NHL repeat-containing protein n=1 Tax=Geothermobacter hydrogeniphilus TaxID=1969733 RepID=A0A1X0XK66_9BACT|nr:hypothetical protein [Geothermobacter hydrogeniphilus]ORJ53256.1 hypothetical protein B5V00_16395 [Geothermobacter hydrogeniphilus]